MSTNSPLYPNEDAFYCRFFTEVSSCVDAAGRRLHEVDFRDEETPGAYVKCPFHDTRRGYLMNKSALTQITSEWSQILEGIGFYTALFESNSSAELNLGRAWRICLASMFAPLYLLHRSKNCFQNGELPTPVSGVFKIMLDVPTTIDLMILKDYPADLPADAAHDIPRQIQTFADENLILLNGEYACAGSPGLIQTVARILFENRKPVVEEYPLFQEYFGYHDEFRRFTYFMSLQYVAGFTYILTTSLAMEYAFLQLHDTRHSSLANPAIEKPSAYERRREIALEAMSRPELRKKSLRRFAALVENPAGWQVESGQNLGISRCVQLSEDFLDFAAGASPDGIAVSYQVYQEQVGQFLLSVQSEVETAIGAVGMFPPAVRFGNPENHPAHILGEMLSAASR